MTRDEFTDDLEGIKRYLEDWIGTQCVDLDDRQSEALLLIAIRNYLS